MSVYETIKMSPLLGLQGSGGGLAYLAGLVGGDKVYVDDVFSTYLYEGTGSAQTITNGIDNTDKCLLWLKCRNVGYPHGLWDTERGTTKYLSTNDNLAEQNSDTRGVSSFNQDGFSLGTGYMGSDNNSNAEIVSLNFKAQKGFFDIVTWSGNGDSDVAIPHSLGSEPGMVIVKRTNATGNWFTYHRSLASPLTKWVSLNKNASETQANAGVNMWGSMTSTHIGIRDYFGLNTTGGTYIAYIFAHDDAQFGTGGDESIIKCGSYTGTNGAHTVSCGFEPQFVMIKRTNSTADWVMIDAMRTHTKMLFPNKSNTEDATTSITFDSTGFGLNYNSSEFNVSGSTYIYMAIRRPHKPPETATEVFNVILSDSPRTAVQRPEKVDMYWFTKTGGFSDNLQVADRVRGFQSTSTNSDNAYTTPTIFTNNTNQERSSGNAIVQQDWSGGPFVTGVSSGNNFLNYMFKRAPGFFDIVAYEGNGTTSNTIYHNLEAVPELMIIKNRDNSTYGEWGTYYKTATAGGPTKYLVLNTSAGEISTGTPGHWRETEPTSTTFALGSDWDVNGSYSYIAYLFATLPGISKVGSYTGNDTARTIDCGFTNGARFVLIKKTSSAGSWLLFDTARGINAGNDPFLEMNYANAEYTSLDVIDSNNSGFNLTSSSAANGSGNEYIFLAIA